MEYLNQIICGDCIETIKKLPDEAIDLVVTSPPYAEQRKNQYLSVVEEEYPQWTAKWVNECRRILKPHGSIAIVIRPHIRNGQISDYILKTRLKLREEKWIEAEELIWVKPDSPPLGNVNRPRRAWESILWFSKTNKPYCDPKANGHMSDRVGFESKKGVGDYKQGVSDAKTGIARCRDYVEVGTGKVDKSKDNLHPAQYPSELVQWIVKLLCPPNGVILDPFMGSGTTAVACKQLGFQYVGIDVSQEYCDYAKKRVAATV